MDTRRSFYLASRADDYDDAIAGGEGRIDLTDIPYIAPANDNSRVKDKLSIRCGTLLHRLIAGLN
jgi:hypothetical protein